MVQLKYFGDSRDYLKYDLITVVLKKLQFNCYVFVPLLTDHRDDNEGQKRPYHEDSELQTFINECNGKSLVHWERWLKRYVNTYQTVEPVDKTFFHNYERQQYWNKFQPLLKSEHSLLFLDPDIGIETGRISKIKTKNKEKYILSNEVICLVKNIPPTSLLMIYQQLQRNSHKREKDLIEKVRRLNNISEDISACAYREDDLAFLFISRSNDIYTRICSCLESYAIIK
jgi:hypothetical protein